MIIDEIRIYAEVLEQGMDFKSYFLNLGRTYKITNIYTKKARGEILSTDSLTTRIRKSKDVDVLITAINKNGEFPLLMVEYSTAVPTDDHKMQRSDVYYWSSVYKVPMLKISPENKGMNQSFGGGDKFTDELEKYLAYKVGAVFIPVKWKTIRNTENLDTKPDALSCINKQAVIHDTLEKLLSAFEQENTFDDYYKSIKKHYFQSNKAAIEDFTEKKAKSAIVNSTRFTWQGSKIISKINRFGHAMDPDRGVLYFTNMLVGVQNCVTEIQVNRTSVNGRGGYKSLFDAAARSSELLRYVQNLIDTQDNKFLPENALYIFERALCIEDWKLFTKKSEREYEINPEKLQAFLSGCPSMTSKCIFYLSSKLILTDQRRNVICSITWDIEPIAKYLESLYTDNHAKTPIKKLENEDAKEDLITYASVELYKRLGCKLIAVSYPGAQGDRCVLLGEGRNVLRTYIDIVALKNSKKKTTVFLEECKDLFSKSKTDADKLNAFISNKQQLRGLRMLINKVNGSDAFDDIKISLGAKYAPSIPFFKVDYIFMFEIKNTTNNQTKINYSVALIDCTLIEPFKTLQDLDGRLRGSLTLDQLYIIK